MFSTTWERAGGPLGGPPRGDVTKIARLFLEIVVVYNIIFWEAGKMGRRRVGADKNEMRKCSACLVWKNREQDFSKLPRGPLGYQSQCKTCKNNYQRRKVARLSRPLALPWKKRRAIIAQQPYCMICMVPRERTNGDPNRHLVIDHCHETGKQRAILCQTCNTGLGHFREDPQLLRNAIEYIEFFRKRNGE